jgi:zeaxanthin glucosyltransferase
MSTIAFLAYPETGHLNPTFKIAKTLKARGHRVYYIGLPDFEEYVQSEGLDFIPIFADLFPKSFMARQVGATVESYSALLAEAKRTQNGNIDPISEFAQLMQRLAPDLVIVDLLLCDFALIMQRINIPFVLLNILFFDPWKEKIRGYESLIGMPELVLCPQEFDFPEMEKKVNRYYVEASIDLHRSEVEFPWHRVTADKPLIYCSFGTQSHLVPTQTRLSFMETLVRAVAQRQDLQLVLATGGDLNANEFSPASSNIILVNSAPQLMLLKQSSMMITHGGINSIKECIYFEVPIITYPLTRDQPANAARVVYHGIGVSGDIQDVSLQQTHSLIGRLSGNTSYKTKIKAMSGKFREIEESQPSMQLIETALRQSTN